MGSGCCKRQQKQSAAESVQMSSKSILRRAQSMTKTKHNKVIKTKISTKFLTQEELKAARGKCLYLKVLLNEDNSLFSKILDYLFLTGIGGLNAENMDNNSITCIVNVSYEMATFQVKRVDAIRIPVEDSDREDISIYFEEVTDLMNEWISKKRGVVVHCLCGISRSVTIVLAYLMKYQKMTLKEAFLHVKKTRPFIRPNNSFFQQLIDYEMKLFKKTTVKMINHKLPNGEIKIIPDIFVSSEGPKEAFEITRRSSDSVYSDTINSSNLI